MRRPIRLYAVLFVTAATLFAGWLSFRVLKPFWTAAAWAMVLAVAFWTPWRALERRFAKKGLAAFLMTTAIALVVLLPAAAFTGLLAAQASDLAATVTQTLRDRHITSPSDLIQLPWIAGALDRVQSLLHISPEEFQAKVTDLLTGASSEIAGLSGQLVLSVFDAVLTFFTTLFLLFFCFRDGDRWTAAVLELLPIAAERRSAEARRLGGMMNEIFRGSLFCALIQGVLGGAGWAIVGLPSPALAGAAMAILSLLPIGGTAIVWLPGSLWLWSRDRTGAAIVLFLWGAILASFVADNVLKPLLIRGAELNTLVVFLGVFGGLTSFGLLGIFIGPIALAFAVTMIEVLRREARGDDVPPAAPPDASAGEAAGI